MDFRRLPVLAGPVVAGLFLLGGCAAGPATSAAAPAESPTRPRPLPAPAAGRRPAPRGCVPAPPAGAPLTLSPEARSEIDRLREQPSGPATAQDPELAARLAEVSQRVERAARPCADR